MQEYGRNKTFVLSFSCCIILSPIVYIPPKPALLGKNVRPVRKIFFPNWAGPITALGLLSFNTSLLSRFYFSSGVKELCFSGWRRSVFYNIAATCFSTAVLIKEFMDIPACFARMAILLCVSGEIRTFNAPE